MSTVTVNGQLAAGVVITEVRRGRWTASVSVPDFEPPADGVLRLKVADEREWVGRAQPGASEVAFDTYVATVRGGLGDVALPATPRHYRFATVGAVLADLAADAGESLDPGIAPTLLGTSLMSHTVTSNAVSVNLTALLARVSSKAVWRITPEGLLWAGEDTFDEYAGTPEIILRSPLEMAMRVWAVPDLPRPGQLFDGRKLGVVEHRVDETGISSTVYFEQLDSADDIKGALQRFIKATQPIDFAATYDAEVRSQAADGSFDVRLTDEKLSEHSHVRARMMSGVVATVKPGTPCTLAFLNGDPSSPVIIGIDPTGLIKLRLGGSDATGSDAISAALKGTEYRAREKQLHTDLVTKLTELSVALGTAATAITPTPGGPAAAGLTAAAKAAADAAGLITAYETEATSAGDWLSTFIQLK